MYDVDGKTCPSLRNNRFRVRQNVSALKCISRDQVFGAFNLIYLCVEVKVSLKARRHRLKLNIVRFIQTAVVRPVLCAFSFVASN